MTLCSLDQYKKIWEGTLPRDPTRLRRAGSLGGMYDTYMGHSIGKYEGDALVVDTAAVKDLTWLDTVGHVHSNQLHVVERMTRPEPDTLQIDFTIDDPKAYTKPWTGRRVFERLSGSKAEILEYVTCQDHLEY